MDYSDTDDLENDLLGPEDLFMDDCSVENEGIKENENEENVEDKKDNIKETAKEIKKKREVKSTRVKLNQNTLMGPNGLPALKKSFENFTFKGVNHEKEDLTKIMQILQQWMKYQLFPSGTFESTMAQLEVLGNKRNVQTYMKKIRMGLDEWGETKPANENNENINETTVNDEELQKENFNQWLNHQMDIVNSDDDLSESEMPQVQAGPSGITAESSNSQNESEIVLTQEQLERIARNKKLAEERKMQRLSSQENKIETNEISS